MWFQAPHQIKGAMQKSAERWSWHCLLLVNFWCFDLTWIHFFLFFLLCQTSKPAAEMITFAVCVCVPADKGICMKVQSVYLPVLSIALPRPLGITAFFCIIKLSSIVYQSMQEDHTHYPNCTTSLSTQKTSFHLVIWVRQAQGNGEIWKRRCHYRTYSCPVPPDYTGGFRVHAWQRRRSWGHIRHISSLGLCQYCITAGEMLVHGFLKDNQAFIIMEFLIEWMHKKSTVFLSQCWF